MRKVLNFNEIATCKDLEQFKNKRVAIEIISLDKDDINKLQNRYLYYCYQIAEFLTDQNGITFSVKDAMLVNSIRLNQNTVSVKIDQDKNLIFFINKAHYLTMDTEQLKNLLNLLISLRKQ